MEDPMIFKHPLPPLVALLLVWCTHSLAQELIKYPSTDPSGNAIEVTALVSIPKQLRTNGQKLSAVVLLHSVGGWSHPVTEQYAKALSEAGVLALEPRLFQNRASAPSVGVALLPMVYDALRYLSERGDVDSKRIGIAGFSFGGAVTLHSAAAWAQAAYSKNPELKFAAHAPFYPSCGLFSAFAQGKRKTPGIPTDALTKWTGAPVKIFAGGRDDYDDRDPNACSELISLLPSAYQPIFSVQLYPQATHAWDQQSASYYDRSACKGRGCVNTTEADPEVTRQGIKDLLDFFGKTLSLPQ